MLITTVAGYTVANPISVPTCTTSAILGGMTPGNYQYKYTYQSPFGETLASTSSATIASLGQVAVTIPPISAQSAAATSIRIYRTGVGNAAPFRFIASIPTNIGGVFIDNLNDFALGGVEPTANTASSSSIIRGQLAVEGIASISTTTIVAGSGADISNAVPISTGVTFVTTNATYDTILMPVPIKGATSTVYNMGPNILKIWFQGGDTEIIFRMTRFLFLPVGASYQFVADVQWNIITVSPQGAAIGSFSTTVDQSPSHGETDMWAVSFGNNTTSISNMKSSTSIGHDLNPISTSDAVLSTMLGANIFPQNITLVAAHSVGYNIYPLFTGNTNNTVVFGNNIATQDTIIRSPCIGYNSNYGNNVIGNNCGQASNNLNIGIGESACANATASIRILCFGYQSGMGITSGINSTFLGTQSGLSKSNGSLMLGAGYQSEMANSIGTQFRLGIGYQAGMMGTASNETHIGHQSGLNVTSGTLNVSYGYQTMMNTITTQRSAAFGANAGVNTNVAGISAGVALGYNSANACVVLPVAFGYNTAPTASTLTQNSINACGSSALSLVTSGTLLYGLGAGAISTATTASRIRAIGYNAAKLSNGVNINAIGSSAVANGTSAINCTGLGFGALSGVTSGVRNMGLGVNAGSAITTTNDNLCINHVGVAGNTGVIRIGTGTAKTYMAGIAGVTTANNNAIQVRVDSAGQLGTVSSAARFKCNVETLGGEYYDKLMRLRPVSYAFRDKGEINDERFVADTVPIKQYPLKYGFISEEIKEVFPEFVRYFDHINDRSPLSTIDDLQLYAPIINAILQQEKMIKQLEIKIG